MRLLATLLLALLLPAAPALADQQLADAARNHHVWINTSANTPPVYEAYPNSPPPQCWGTVYIDNAAKLVTNVPFVAGACVDFKPSPGSDGEVVIRDHVNKRTFEFWHTYKAADGTWHATWGGADDDANFHWSDGVRAWDTPGGWAWGVQASGLAFQPGLITVSDLWKGTIDHPIHMLVPYACATFKAPATRHDGGVTTDAPGCIQYGQKYRLPADVDISGLPFIARVVAQAAKTYYLIASDETGTASWPGVLGFRAEDWKRTNSWWAWTAAQTLGELNPYWDPAYPPNSITSQWGGHGFDYFGCTAVPANYQCYPDQNNLLRNFPWAQLVAVN